MKSIFQNTRKPEGFWGRMILRGMNRGHAPLSAWGMTYLRAAENARILDIGCGGGANIARMLRLWPQSFVEGVDYSPESVKMSRRKNKALLGTRCAVREGDVSALPYENGAFDAATAFETVYFWPEPARAFAEVRRVLRPGGMFLIVCEGSDPADATWTSRIGGMTVYSGEELRSLLQRAGFSEPVLRQGRKEWICLTARA
jgi:SAM-dependent methyltransferase